MKVRWARFAWNFLGRGLLLALFCSAAQGQPLNDNFANRTKVWGEAVQVEASNVAASLELDEPAELIALGGASAWWEWAVPTAGLVEVSTAGSGFDTVVAVFTGNTLDALSLVAANDDENLLGGVFTSRVIFFARSGSRYQIAVTGTPDGAGGFATGAIHLQIAPAAMEPVPAWEVATLDGERLDSSALTAKILLLDFWATWCVPCRAEIPGFIALQNRYRDAGLLVLGVSVDTVGTNAVRAFAEELGINYPLAMTTLELERAVGGVPSIPTAFILDSKNNLITRQVGFREHDFWDAEIRSLLDTETEPILLTASRTNEWIELSWPASASSWLLQSSDDLAGAAWSAVSTTAENREGRMFLTLPLTNAPARFFRLFQPDQ